MRLSLRASQAEPAKTEAESWLRSTINPSQPRLVWIVIEGGEEIDVVSYDLGVVPGA